MGSVKRETTDVSEESIAVPYRTRPPLAHIYPAVMYIALSSRP